MHNFTPIHSEEDGKRGKKLGSLFMSYRSLQNYHQMPPTCQHIISLLKATDSDWNCVLWSDETEIELFGNKTQGGFCLKRRMVALHWWAQAGPSWGRTALVACWSSWLLESASLLFHESHLFPSCSAERERGNEQARRTIGKEKGESSFR